MRINFKLFSIVTTLFLGTVITMNAQTVTGAVMDADGYPVPDAEVTVVGSSESAYTDENGEFSMKVPEGKGSVEVFTVTGVQTVGYNVTAGNTQDLGVLTARPSLKEVVAVGKGVIDIEEDRQTPIAVNTIFRDEIQEKAQGNVEFPEVLANTPSVYVSNQSGGFGDSQMFTRGFDQSNTAFLLNGQPINGMEDGKMYWSNWSGMTEIANAVQIQRGLGSSKLAISSVGGTINIITKASEKTKGGYVQSIVGNDSYFKFGGGYNTGISEKGWAFSFALSYWTAHRKFARGTNGEGQNYFLSVGKKINEAHNLNFLITGAPQWHGQNFSKEFDYGNGLGYDYFDDKWNANAGFMNGEEFTWRRNYYHKPVINLNWDWDISPKQSLSTVLYGSFGRGGGTGPRGNTRAFDVFRGNTASYYAPENGYFLFDRIYQANLQVANGEGSYNNGHLRRSSVNNHNWFGLVSNFNWEVSDNFSFNVGFDGRSYKGDHFRQVSDFMGLTSWANDRPDGGVVTESFAAAPWAALTNFAGKEQRIDYDNSEWISYFGGFGQAEYVTEKFSVYFQGAVSSQSYKREDRFHVDENGNVGSLKSGSSSKIGYNAKGGFAYNFTPSNAIYFNSGYYSRQPYLDNIFDARRNHITEFIQPDVENEEITGFEAGYKFGNRAFNMSINGYFTTWANRTIVRRGGNYAAPDGIVYSEVVIQESGIKQEHKGVELDFRGEATSKFTYNGYFSYGDWNIVDGFTTKVFDDQNSSEQVDQFITGSDVTLKVTQAPQFSTGFGMKYQISRVWSTDMNFNYYALNYDRFKNNGYSTIKPYALVNMGTTYNIKIGKQRMKFRANVYNLFNTEYIAQGEQYGYFYGNGTTYNMGLTMNF